MPLNLALLPDKTQQKSRLNLATLPDKKQPAEQPMTVGRYIAETAGNILPNTGRLISGQAQAMKPIMEDINAAGGMVNPIAPAIAAGKAAYRQFMPLVKNPQAADQIRNQMVTGVKETVKHPLNYIKENPVDAAMWASTGLGAVGTGAKAAGLSRMAQLAIKASELTNPASIALKGAGLAATGAGKVAGAFGWNPKPVIALIKAVRPGKWNKTFKNDAPVALKELQKVGTAIGKENPIDDFVGGLSTAKKNIWAEIEQAEKASEGKLVYGQKTITTQEPVTEVKLFNEFGQDMSKMTKPVSKNITVLKNGIEGDNIANKIEVMIDPDTVKLHPEVGTALSREANKYKGKQITINELENDLKLSNAELTGYFKSSNRRQYVMGEENDIAAKLIKRQVIREELFKKIESLTGKDIAPLRKKYGALMNVQDEAMGRMMVDARKNNIGLQKAINIAFGATSAISGNPAGLFHVGASLLIDKLNSPAYLLQKAISGSGKMRLGQRIYQAGKYPKFTPPEKPVPTIGSFLKNEKGGILPDEFIKKNPNTVDRGESYDILGKKGEYIGHITGDDSIGRFRLFNTEINKDVRGTGRYQKAIQEVANRYPQGLISDKYQTSTALKKALLKMNTAVETPESIIIKSNKFPHNEKGNIALPDKYRQTIESIKNRKNPYEGQLAHIKKSIDQTTLEGKKLEDLLLKSLKAARNKHK